ncbi:hypothetical protein [Streptosporangium sp. NPDC000396]|uniref:hypothetical protein n=1 Tax=Streptosporangium sp. NPDC000396 TaxID=3366185 RepID=UPI003687AD5D
MSTGVRRGVMAPGVRRAVTSRVDDDDTLRIEWPEPDDGGQVTWRHVETGQEHTGAGLAGLRPGIWMASCRGEPVATDDPGFSLDGLVVYAGRPRTREVRAFRTTAGTLGLTVREVAPYVEVTGVGCEDGVIEVEGVLAYGVPVEGPARLVAVARKGSDPVSAPGVFRGRGFSGSVPIGPMAGGQVRRRMFWDLLVEVGGERLPLAARLDDIADKKTKVRFPAQHVGARHAGQVRVRPYYTDTDSLAVALTAEEESA